MRYGTIVADPPWHYDDFRVNPGGRTSRHEGLPYPSMTLEEIAALPVAELIEPMSCIVWLWTTQKYLPHAFPILAAWGATYRQTVVWKKRRGSPFSYPVAPMDVEFLLAGTVGSVTGREVFPSAVMAAGRPGNGSHSSKPEAFLDYIEANSPAPRIELFARRQRFGWDTWGNEAFEHINLGGDAEANSS